MTEEVINSLKNILLFAFTAVLSIITTAQGAFISLAFGFMFNFFIGLNADRIKHGKEFSLRKATEGIKLFMFYVIIVFFVFAILYNKQEFANEVVNWLTYVVSYFYLTNIFRNAKTCLPNSRSVDFIYKFLSTEVFAGMKQLLAKKIGINIPDEERDNENEQ
jgi:hypothetical protein